MSVSVTELRRWLFTLPIDSEVGIDEGGLTLCVVGEERVYFEVGGMPEEDEDATTTA
jgi:hypothetical protein